MLPISFLSRNLGLSFQRHDIQSRKAQDAMQHRSMLRLSQSKTMQSLLKRCPPSTSRLSKAERDPVSFILQYLQQNLIMNHSFQILISLIRKLRRVNVRISH